MVSTSCSLDVCSNQLEFYTADAAPAETAAAAAAAAAAADDADE